MQISSPFKLNAPCFKRGFFPLQPTLFFKLWVKLFLRRWDLAARIRKWKQIYLAVERRKESPEALGLREHPA